MAYAPVSSAVAAPESGPLVDHQYGRVYNFAIVDGAQTGCRWFDAYPNGDEQRARTIADIGIAANNGPGTFCYTSQLLALANQGSNGGIIYFLDKNDFSLRGSFGMIDSSFDNTVDHIGMVLSMVAVQAAPGVGGDVLIANCDTNAFNNQINAITVQGRNEPQGTLDETTCVLGALPDGSGTEAYAIGLTTGGTATQIGYYRLKPTIVPVRKIPATDIDAAWVHVDDVYGVAVDQTDGNLLFAAHNQTDAPTHPHYLVKINVATGAVIWRIALNMSNGLDFKQCLIKNGLLHYLSVTDSLAYAINTVSGVATPVTLSDFLVGPLHVKQVSEDVTGSAYWFGSWTETDTHPEYLGTYCLVEGHTSGSGLDWRWFPNGAPNPAPVFPIAAQSRRRAWSFAFDGHVFYILDLGVEGTFAYDDTTQQWSKFITQAWNGWNLTNGTVWGRRVVGGDFMTGDIWEMQPGALMDNGSVEIVHVVTGGLVKRNRVYSSVESLRLNVSVGQLDDVNGATIQLAFSDDQGVTYTDMGVIALTEGDYSTEIVWRSLGAFAAPGRVFRVTDVGAFLRIDGADAAIDNFDEDSAPPASGG